MEKGYDLTTEMCNNLSAFTGRDIQPNYGQEINLQELQLSGADDMKVFLSITRVLPENKLMKATNGMIQEGDAILTFVGKKAFNLVRSYQQFFDYVYATPDGQGLPPCKFTAGAMTVWGFRPVGGMTRTAIFLGDKYGIEQLVYFLVEV